LTTKETKLPTENFCIEVSDLDWLMHRQKFVSLDLRLTKIFCLGLAGWKKLIVLEYRLLKQTARKCKSF